MGIILDTEGSTPSVNNLTGTVTFAAELSYVQFVHVRHPSRTQPSSLSRHDTYPTSLPRTGFSPDHDLDVLVERRRQVHQAFD
jgi:hypothetical protein